MFSKFFTKKAHDSSVFVFHAPKFHIVNEIDSYDPSSLSQWIEKQITIRMNDMNKLLSDPDSIINKLFRQHSIPFHMLSLQYKSLMSDILYTTDSLINSTIYDLDKLISKMDILLEQLRQLDEKQLMMFVSELRNNLIKRWSILSHYKLDILSSITKVTVSDIEKVDMMLSFYIYGKFTTNITRLLFVIPYETGFSGTLINDMINPFQVVPEGETETILSTMNTLFMKYFHSPRLQHAFVILKKQIDKIK